MISVNLIFILIGLHFLGDFIFQSDRMALNKSKSEAWLTLHVFTYCAVLAVFSNWKFWLFNFVAHYITDWISSRATSSLWKQEKRHAFFVVIGADQAVHLACLVWSAEMFL